MKKMLKCTFIILLLVLVPTLILWGKGVKEEEVVSETKEEGTKGTFVFLSAENLLGFWDTANMTNLAYARLELALFDSLVVFDDEVNILPRLATSWKRIDDTTFEFTLRKGVKFHEGQSFGAADVKATLEYYTKPKQIGNH